MAEPSPPALPAVETLDASGVRALGAWLALEHEREARCDGATSARLERERLARDCRTVTEHLPSLTRLAERVAAEQWRFLEAHADRLTERGRDGRFREARGPRRRLDDLVPGRHPGVPGDARDTAAEVACVALDFELDGRGDLAERLLSAYAGEADDFDLFGVIGFFERACALERAASLAADAGTGARRDPTDEARRLLILGLSTGRRPLVPPVLVAIGGHVATGKSTVARALAEHLGAPHIEADAVRNALLGDRPGRRVHEARWAESLAPDFEDRVYRELWRRAARVLASGRPLVVAACFPRARQRREGSALARRAGFPFLFVECRPERSTVAKRLAARDAADGRGRREGGWKAIHAALETRWEVEDDLPPDEHLALDTSGPIGASVARLEARLPGWPAALRS